MNIQDILDPQKLISLFGLIGVFAIVFAESGLFFGFFLPGDSLLFTAGLLSSQGLLPFWILLIGVFVSAVLGDNVGYWFGKKIGPALFVKEESLFFKRKYIAQAQHFYEKYGKKTIILSRFIPVVRTFAPIVAGIGDMNYRIFFIYNIVGGFLWSTGLTVLGYVLGNTIPGIDKYLLPIILFIIFVSFLPPVYQVLKSYLEKNKNIVQ
jgi:membrane-associated protein